MRLFEHGDMSDPTSRELRLRPVVVAGDGPGRAGLLAKGRLNVAIILGVEVELGQIAATP